MARFISGLLVLWLVAFAAPAQAQPTAPDGWRAQALADLAAARDVIATQTPIPNDAENPAYAAWLRDGYAEAAALAGRATNQAEALYAVARFVNGFRDPHLGLRSEGRRLPLGWPGFIAAAGPEGAVVVHRNPAQPDAPPLGAAILACDGQDLATRAMTTVFPFTLNPRIAVDRRRAMSWLFLDPGVAFAPAPARCRFRISGVEEERGLRYSPAPPRSDPFWTAVESGATGPAAQFGLTEPAPGVAWIGVPTFASGGDAANELEALIAALDSAAPRLREGRAIVLDLRGNTGGNSAWADRLATAVFGPALVRAAHRRSRAASAVDWRASPENLAYWRTFRTDVAIAEFGAGSDAVRFTDRVIAGLEGAIARGEPLWREGARTLPPGGGLTQRRPAGPRPFPARVLVLSNGTCQSSCLNFADTVLHIPGVELVGADTGADGLYMEVRTVPLPSGLLRLTFPQKVRRGGGRGAFEAYAADRAFPGPWDDAAVRAWVLDLIGAER